MFRSPTARRQPYALRDGGGYTYVLKVASYNPVAHWQLNDTSGTSAIDSSGNGYHGTYSGVTLNALALPGATMGNAAQFNGTSAYVSMPLAFRNVTSYRNEGTLMMWINTPTYANNYAFRVTTAAGSPNAFSLEVRITTTNFLIRRSGGNDSLLGANYAHASVAGWICLAMRWSVANNALAVFQNGTSKGTATSIVAAGTGALTSTQAQIGANVNSPFSGGYSGYIGHVAIFASALGDSAITDLATAI